MAKFFGNLNAVLGAGVVLLIILMFALHGNVMDAVYWNVWFRFVHVLCGIMWIGLLYYFNFVQTPTMPSIPAELKPGVTKYIAPRALFWFRWAALATVLTGATVAGMPGPNGPYLVEALTFHAGSRVIGTGMWLALIMAFNVWFLIWPAQKKVLGLVEADADAKAKAATTGLVFSRINVLLSIPMLYCMVTQFYLPR